METPYGVTNDAGQLCAKAVVYDTGSVSAYVYGTTPTNLPPGPYTYPDFATAQTAVGGTWSLYGAH